MSNQIAIDIANVLRTNLEKLDNLKKFLDVSLKISDHFDKKDEDSIDAVIELVEEREKLIATLKNDDVAINHYLSKLPTKEALDAELINKSGGKNLLFDGWRGELCKIKIMQRGILDSLRDTEQTNNVKGKAVLESLKVNLGHLRKNRRIMEKYIPDEIKPGTIQTNKTI